MNTESLMTDIIEYQLYDDEKYCNLKSWMDILIRKYKEEFKNIKIDEISTSEIHGINHAERVLFFSLLIGDYLNLSDIEMQLIIDAAKYHDVGRTYNKLVSGDNFKTSGLVNPKNKIYEKVTEDHGFKLHGLLSAKRIPSIVDTSISPYNNETNLNTLKAMIELHSINDSNAEFIMRKYDLEDTDPTQFRKLYSVLKDADALDRKRYFDKEKAAFDPSYLRHDISKTLISSAEELNNIYREVINLKETANDDEYHLTFIPKNGRIKQDYRTQGGLNYGKESN